MKTKNIKVVYTSRYSQGMVPKIQMEGKWLEQLGFAIGTPLILEYEENSIHIRPLNDAELKMQKQHTLKAELKLREAELKKLESILLLVAEPSPKYSASSLN